MVDEYETLDIAHSPDLLRVAGAAGGRDIDKGLQVGAHKAEQLQATATGMLTFDGRLTHPH